jgi:hypothetical protein
VAQPILAVRYWTSPQVVMHSPAEQHLPENVSNKPIDLILIEFKS